MLSIYNEFIEGHHGEVVDASELGMWAIRSGKYKVEESAILSKFKEDLARALRSEHHTDPQGRSVRTNHVVVENRNGKQISMWGDIRTAPREHIQKSFKQRRKQIVGHCCQLKADVDSFNDNHNKGTQLEFSFNFSVDIIEANLAKEDLSLPKGRLGRPTIRPPRIRRPGSPPAPPAV